MVCPAGIWPGSWWDPSLPGNTLPRPASATGALPSSGFAPVATSVSAVVWLELPWQLCPLPGTGGESPLWARSPHPDLSLLQGCPGHGPATFGGVEEVAVEVTSGSPHAVTSPGAVTVLASLTVGCLNPPLCSPQTTMLPTAGKPSGKGRRLQVSGGQRPLAPSLAWPRQVGFGPGGGARPPRGVGDTAQGPSLPRPGGAVLEAGEGAAGGAEEAAEPSGERWAWGGQNWAH